MKKLLLFIALVIAGAPHVFAQKNTHVSDSIGYQTAMAEAKVAGDSLDLVNAKAGELCVSYKTNCDSLKLIIDQMSLLLKQQSTAYETNDQDKLDSIKIVIKNLQNKTTRFNKDRAALDKQFTDNNSVIDALTLKKKLALARAGVYKERLDAERKK